MMTLRGVLVGAGVVDAVIAVMVVMMVVVMMVMVLVMVVTMVTMWSPMMSELLLTLTGNSTFYQLSDTPLSGRWHVAANRVGVGGLDTSLKGRGACDQPLPRHIPRGTRRLTRH